MKNKEIEALVEKYDVDMQQVTTLLDAAIDTLKEWETRPDPRPTPAELTAHQDTLLLAYGRQRVLQGDTDALKRLLARLLAQHQSAQAAFRLGWEARLTELLAHLNDAEEKQLRKLLRDIQTEADMPF